MPWSTTAFQTGFGALTTTLDGSVDGSGNVSGTLVDFGPSPFSGSISSSGALSASVNNSFTFTGNSVTVTGSFSATP